MKLFPILLLAAMISISLLAHNASAGYTETLTVQVFDQDFRPVDGALVYVEYQLNGVQGNIKTKPHPTDSTGYYTLVFTDYEQIDASLDRTYTLFVKYGGQLEKAILTATDGEKRVYTMRVDSYYAFVKVHDQKGHPIAADVTISGDNFDAVQRKTDENGNVGFQLPPGSYTVKTEYNGVAKNKDFKLSADQAIDILFGVYSLDVKVTDDRKKPLDATVEIGTQSAQTDASGIAHLVNISDETPSVVIKYADRYKTYRPDLSLGTTLDAVIDMTKPVIKDLHSTVSGSGGATVTFFVEDSGSAASGVDTVSVSYTVAGVETPVPAYTVGYNTFEAKIPAQEPGTLVRYSVKVADKDGNAAVGMESYLVPESAAIAPTPVPKPVPPIIPTTTGGVPTEFMVILVVAGLLVVYAVFYYLKRKKEEDMGRAQMPSSAQPSAGMQPPSLGNKPPEKPSAPITPPKI
ncbi:MAG: carboxypeptidase-like regulatory domain-containing protein [Candidatus Micrarchaeota archaeon]|nr:carboxypeptidase-like regulatory domain-containing protein [Candidatus Micrarchaeota archaeon]